MISFRRILRGAVWNWAAFGTTAVVAFFLSPFVVHHLGNTVYGVWVLVNSVVSYMGLLDLGMRGAVVRFVSNDQAQGRHEEAGQAVSAALWFRIWVGVLILIIAGFLSLSVTRFFHIPVESQSAARFVVLLTGATLALSISFGVFTGVLNALHRFDLISALEMGQSLLGAAGIVVLLRRGHSIVAMASWLLLVCILYCATAAALAFRAYPQLHLALRPHKGMLRKLWGYSLLLFVINLNGRIIYYTDSLVVGAFLPVSAVTFYAIGAASMTYLASIISSVGVTFLPAASNLDAVGEFSQLHRLLIHGTRMVLLVTLPIEVALFFRGPTFIRLWMGPEYAEPSGQVLRVLVVAWMFIAANSCAGNVAYGLAKHRPMAIWTTCEALANLGLSIALVQRMGIVGVAWGTVIPSLVIQTLIWPWYISKIVRMRVRQYLWQAWGRTWIAIAPFALACYLTERLWTASRLIQFFLQIAALLPLVLLGFLLCFRREILERLRTWKRRVAETKAAEGLRV